MNINRMIKELENYYMSISETITRLDEDLDNGKDVADIIRKLTDESFDVLDAIKALRKVNKYNIP